MPEYASGSMLVGGMNPVRGRGKADASVEAIITNHFVSSLCSTLDPQPGHGDRSVQVGDDLRLLDLEVEPFHQWLDTGITVADTTRPSRNRRQWVASRIAEGRGHSR
jgi:hypothetical protein